MAYEFNINSAKDLLAHFAEMQALFDENGWLDGKVESGKIRTGQQRKAIEVYCRELAKAFNDKGLDQRAVMAKMKDGVEIPWRQESVKANLFKPIVDSLFGKDSTTKLERPEVSRVYDVLNRWTSNTFGISLLFPEAKD